MFQMLLPPCYGRDRAMMWESTRPYRAPTGLGFIRSLKQGLRSPSAFVNGTTADKSARSTPGYTMSAFQAGIFISFLRWSNSNSGQLGCPMASGCTRKPVDRGETDTLPWNRVAASQAGA
jgi:hypothetical protein